MSATPDPADYVTVEVAGKLAGISPRTLRYWIRTGKLSAIAGKRGKLVRAEEVHALAVLAGKAPGNVGSAHATPATFAEDLAGNAAGNAAEPLSGERSPLGTGPPDERRLSSDTALVDTVRRAEAEALVQRLLAPFVAELGAVREELGRERARREAAERERDELRARLDAAQAAPAAPEAPTVLLVEADGHTHPAPLWQRLLRRIRGG